MCLRFLEVLALLFVVNKLSPPDPPTSRGGYCLHANNIATQGGAAVCSRRNRGHGRRFRSELLDASVASTSSGLPCSLTRVGGPHPSRIILIRAVTGIRPECAVTSTTPAISVPASGFAISYPNSISVRASVFTTDARNGKLGHRSLANRVCPWFHAGETPVPLRHALPSDHRFLK